MAHSQRRCSGEPPQLGQMGFCGEFQSTGRVFWQLKQTSRSRNSGGPVFSFFAFLAGLRPEPAVFPAAFGFGPTAFVFGISRSLPSFDTAALQAMTRRQNTSKRSHPTKIASSMGPLMQQMNKPTVGNYVFGPACCDVWACPTIR
jgi:hypothetical protein